MSLEGKNILVIMPRNQFSEDELFGILGVLEKSGARLVVLSKSGQEAMGMNRKRYQPHGLIVDWDKQDGVFGKYHAVLLVGGKGAQKFLWDDPIVLHILVDHHRAGKVVGALGSALVVLAKASLLEDTAAPEHDPSRTELSKLGVACVDQPVLVMNKIVTGSGGSAAELFAAKVVELLSEASE